ncbi:MAG: hypothetical protein J0H32_14660, partial [Rhizobiales bacterium]|nr:hypothetical protein [Hyphomicrobiales bacterium]
MAFNGKSAACAPLTANKAAADPIIIAFVVVVIFISKPALDRGTLAGHRESGATRHHRQDVVSRRRQANTNLPPASPIYVFLETCCTTATVAKWPGKRCFAEPAIRGRISSPP